MIGAIGAFVQQSKISRSMVEEHDKRIRAVEEMASSSSALLARATTMLDRVSCRLDDHERSAECGTHRAELRHLNDGLEHLQDRVDGMVGK